MANLNDEDKKKKKVKSFKKEEKKESLSVEEKLKDTEEKFLRSLAELENQRKKI